MGDFLDGNRLPRITFSEKALLATGVLLCIVAWPLNGIAWLSNTATGVGIACLGALTGSLTKDWRFRRALFGSGLDSDVRLYVHRSQYATLLRNVEKADEVDILGMSLSYALNYLRDNCDSFFARVGHIRIVLPAKRQMADDRDRAQGSAVGALWRSLADQKKTLEHLQHKYPTKISVRYATIQTYCALTRVDGHIWVAPYVAKGGNASPVLAVTKARSTALFATYSSHFQRIWETGLERPE